MSAFIVTLHIIACLVLIVLVLLQSGKEGMGVIFGGGSSSVFGSAGAGGLLVKITGYVSAVFLITSLAYNYYSSAERRAGSSVMQNVSIEDIKPKAGSDAAKAAKDALKAPVTFEDVKTDLPKPGVAAPATAAVPAAAPAADMAAAKPAAETPKTDAPAAPDKPAAAPPK